MTWSIFVSLFGSEAPFLSPTLRRQKQKFLRVYCGRKHHLGSEPTGGCAARKSGEVEAGQGFS